jgi:Asp-tRNA(Asn)/Glu-tRNA(Gln) amidotransferase A subunit family amidase
MRLLVPTTILLEDLDPVVERTFGGLCETLMRAGHTLERRPVPLLQEVTKLYNQYGSFASHEALALHEDLIEEFGERMDPRVTRRIMEVKGRPATEYIRLTLERARLIREFWQDYCNYDAVLSPTVAILPPPIIELEDEERYSEVNKLCLRNTSIFNFFGGPAVSVPIEPALPVGAMIATAPHQERLSLQIAMEVERRY